MNKSFLKIISILVAAFLITWTFSCTNPGSDSSSEDSTPKKQEKPEPEPTPDPNPEVKYTITFKANNATATGSTASITAVAGTTVTLTANGFALEGYNFTGWNTAADGSGTGYGNSASLQLTSNLTLYAQWILATVPTYTITIAETEHGTVTASQTVSPAGTEITITVTPEQYYEVDTVTVTAADNTEITIVVDQNNNNIRRFSMPDKNVIINVTTILESYTVSFYTDCSASVPSQRIRRGEKAIAPDYPSSREVFNHTVGYKDWFVDIERKTKFNFNTEITENIVLYARWDTYYVSKSQAAEKIRSLNYSCKIRTSGDSDSIGEINKALKELYLRNSSIKVSLEIYISDLESASESEPNKAFYGCQNLNSIELNNIETIGSSAFEGCTNLTYVYINPKWEDTDCCIYSIGDRAFYNCPRLETISLHGNIDNWCNISFGGKLVNGVSSSFKLIFNSTYLTGRIAFPDNLRTIPDYAFTGLIKQNTSITLNNTVTSIGANAFADCEGLTSVDFGNGVTSIGESAFNNCNKLESVTIPETVQSLGKTAFNNCTKLGSVTINNAAIDILENTFNNCTSLSTVSLGNNITSIGEGAFHDCKSITNLVIPDSVTTIGIGAFNGCASLTEITIPFVGGIANGPTPGNRGKGSEETLFGYIFGTESYSGGELTSQHYQPVYGMDDYKPVKYYIPSLLKKITVTGGQLYFGAFEHCKSLEEVILGDSVCTGGPSGGIEDIFSGCSSLESCKLPEGMVKIGERTFKNCSKLKNVVLPSSIKNIYRYAFYGTAITVFEIPDGVERIWDHTFSGCTQLTSVVIPSSVTSIYSTAFENCSNLNEVIFRDTISSWKTNNTDIGPMSATDTAANAEWLTNYMVENNSSLIKITN